MQERKKQSMPTNIATKNNQRKKRRDKPGKVKQANKKMREAWELGTELIDELGMFSGYGAMRDRAKGDNSLAEKYRKYRGMADCLSEKELRDICDLCEKEEKGWGPTFLVELSRITTSRGRKQMAKKAIQHRWGLIEFKRQIRLIIGSGAGTVNRVGRKRLLDWKNKAEVLDQLSQICLGWTHFSEDLQTNTLPHEPGLNPIPPRLQKEFLHVSQQVAQLHRRIVQTMARK